MTRNFPLVALVTLVACGPKGPEAKGAMSDSTSVAAPATDSATDSATRLDSGVAKATPADTIATKPKSGTTAKRPEIIGHDSAFGPTFVLDSNGKAIPITKKRP